MKDITYKNSLIRVKTTEYKGKEYVDIRKYYQDKETKEWKPTRKGIFIPLEILEQIKSALKELE